MNLLFDIAPEDPGRKPGRRPTPPARVVPQPAADPPPPARPAVGQTLGVTEDHPCERCGGCYADILDYDRRESLVSCVFCGQRDWVRLPARPSKAEWVFPSGIHEGLTVAEAFAADPDYVVWAATQSPSEILREKCRFWLDDRKSRL